MRLHLALLAATTVAALAAPAPRAQTAPRDTQVIARVVEAHILPGYAAAAAAATALATAAEANCTPTNAALRAAYHDAFDAWLGVAHLQFGPALENNRGFAMGFWPDPRGAGPRTLARLIRDEAEAGADPAAYRQVSVAARGLHALETMLFDARTRETGTAAYRCILTGTIAADIAATAGDLHAAWQGGYAETMTTAGAPGNTVFPAPQDALRALYGAAETSLRFNAEVRLGRPLGTFERAYPTRAEAWRSGRSLRNVTVSVAAIGDLAALLAEAGGPELAQEIAGHREQIVLRAARVDDPSLQGISDPQARLRVETVQSAVAEMGRTLAQGLAPALGVTGGFNALDGD